MTDMRAIQGSSFAVASRLLPRETREATLGLYAACRALDDIADRQGGDAAGWRLGRVRDELSGSAWAEVLPESRVFLDLDARHGLDLAPARHLVTTLEGDLSPARLANEPELLAYAHGAAGTVGEMMSDLLCPGGLPREARARAADLGIAMQLTNIARDVREDAALGRRYLPGDWCPVPPERLIEPAPDARDAASRAVMQTLSLAERHYARARQGYAALPRRARLAVALAAERYREIGLVIMARPGLLWQDRARPGALGQVRCYARGLGRAISTPGPGSCPGRRPRHA